MLWATARPVLAYEAILPPKPEGSLLRLNDLRQCIRLGFVAYQMRVLFSLVVIQLVSLVVFRVFDQHLDRTFVSFRGLKSVAQDVVREAAAVGGDHPFDGVGNRAILPKPESQRVTAGTNLFSL